MILDLQAPVNTLRIMAGESQAERLATNPASAILQRTKDGWPCYGRYLIRVSGTPRFPKPASDEGRTIIDQAVQYISVTGTMESHGPERLFSDAAGAVCIEKVGRQCGSKVEVVTTDAIAG
jgi:hypothetical protein